MGWPLTVGPCPVHPQAEDFHGDDSAAIFASINVGDDGGVVVKVGWLSHDVCCALQGKKLRKVLVENLQGEQWSGLTSNPGQ